MRDFLYSQINILCVKPEIVLPVSRANFYQTGQQYGRELVPLKTV